ncbi:ATP-dependent RNA helicase DEAH12, chloroplastic [Favolaschia claudopus]|uniref:RBR-type E3 ubiquitin transferase n=1 Tax=Favolaschia claudopus TaxID=2862362 RepID=A0AAW0CAS7_9AGAR
MASTVRPQLCKHFSQGRCPFGDNCKFSHHDPGDSELSQPTRGGRGRRPGQQGRPTPVQPNGAPSSAQRPSVSNATAGQVEERVQSASTLSGKRQGPKRGEKPCFAWRDGHCPKGDKCWFAHNPEVQEAERLRKEHAARVAEQHVELERQRIARLARQAAEQRAAERARQLELQAQKAETRRQEAVHTAQHIILGTSLVTYGAGIAVQEVVPGFETCRIQIQNLPSNVTHNDIKALFTQQGVDERRVFIVGTKQLPGRRIEATLITNSEEGGAIAAGLEDIEFGDERLHFEVTENSKSGGMGSTSKDSDLLKISWRAPSTSVVATFGSVEEAAKKVKELDRQMCAGRRVHVVMNQPPPGYTRGADWQRAVKITNLPSAVLTGTVTQFTGSYGLRFLKPISYDLPTGLRSLRQHIERICGRNLKSFDVTEDNTEGNITVRARFNDWETAKRMQDSLEGRQMYLGGCTPRLWLPNPLQYIISIPRPQYEAQKRTWDSLTGSDGASSRTAYLHVFPAQNGRMQIKVHGEDKTAVGSLKVRVENLVAGKPLPGYWHRSFNTPTGSQYLNTIFDRSGAYARADKLGVVKVYGDDASIDRARDIIKAEVNRLDAMEWSVFLKKQSIRFFVQRGIAILKEALGEENATLVISPRPGKLVVRGGEDARRLVTRLIDESLEEVAAGPQQLDAGEFCPICYDEITHPITLGCDHTYCMSCLRHYLSTASDTFPLICLGNEATCEVPISIPTIERFLTKSQFQQLLESAFLRHVERHPEHFKYCKTADCTQIYRCTATATAMTCPSCFLTVCSRCDLEGHEGMSCEDKRLQSDPGEQERRNDEWAQTNGAKRCPTCSVWIQKTEGCNHMTCRCGAHICWVCMRVFDHGQIYAHLQAAHGGLIEVPPEDPRPQPVLPRANAVPPPDQYVRVPPPLPPRPGAAVEEARRREVERQRQLEQNYRQRLEAIEEERRQQEVLNRRRREEAARQEELRRRRRRENSGWGCLVM